MRAVQLTLDVVAIGGTDSSTAPTPRPRHGSYSLICTACCLSPDEMCVCVRVCAVVTEGGLQFALFDVGQYERINRADTLALLWTLSWISSPENHERLRRVATRHLVDVSTFIAPTNRSGTAAGAAAGAAGATAPVASPAKLISAAFDDAVASNADGTFPDKKTAYMLFLRNAEQRGVLLPQGAFALAKMLDGIISQQESYGLQPVVDVRTKEVIVSSLSTADYYELARAYVGLWR